MSWLRRRRRSDAKVDDARADRLDVADRKARELQLRGEKVAAALEARQRRNHWGDTVAGIIAAAAPPQQRGR